MNYNDEATLRKVLKPLILRTGRKSKEDELRNSEYMEPEYQESDFNRGVDLLSRLLHEMKIDEEIRLAEIEEEKRERAGWDEEAVAQEHDAEMENVGWYGE
jgi:hypothetical protein